MKKLSLLIILGVIILLIPLIANADTIISSDGEWEYQISQNSPICCDLVAYRGSKKDISIPNEIDNLIVQSIPKADYFFYNGLNANTVIFTEHHRYWNSTSDTDSPKMLSDDGIWTYMIRIDPWPYSPEDAELINKPYIYIMAYNGNTDEENIIIPEQLHECSYPVRGISSHAFSFLNAKSITFPSSIIVISSEAFYKCPNLEIDIPSQLVQLSNSPAIGCKKVVVSCKYSDYNFPDVDIVEFKHNIVKHNKVNSSDTYWACSNCGQPFSDEDGSAEIDIADHGRCGENVVWMLDKEGLLTISGTGEMYNGAPWDEYKGIKNIVIEDGVTNIGKYAFNNRGIDNIWVGESVTDIGYMAFYGARIGNIYLPDNIVNIEEFAFSTNGSNEKIYTSMNSKTSYTLAVYGHSFIDKDSDFAFRYQLTQDPLTLKWGEPIIGIVLSGCRNLDIVSCNIPEYVTCIASYAFSQCSKLQSITLSNHITTIDNHAFDDCSSLKSIIIPDGVTFIGSGVFEGCTSLQSLTLPDSVTTINGSIWGDYFYNGNNLSEIIVHSCDSYAYNWAKENGYEEIAKIQKHNSLIHHDRVDATYTTAGTEEYWKCTTCNRLFSDSEASIEIKAPVTIPTLNSPGDINLDGIVDGRDVILLMKYLAEEIDPETGLLFEINKNNADVTGDGILDAKDVLRLVKYLGGENVVLERGKIVSIE